MCVCRTNGLVECTSMASCICLLQTPLLPPSGITRAHCLSHPSVCFACVCVCVCDFSWNSLWTVGNCMKSERQWVSLSSLFKHFWTAATQQSQSMKWLWKELDVVIGCCNMLPAVRPNITSGNKDRYRTENNYLCAEKANLSFDPEQSTAKRWKVLIL